MDARSRRAIRLSFTTFCYLVFGALAFAFFEQEANERSRLELERVRAAMQAKYNFSAQDFALLEENVITGIPFAAGHQWQFVGAFYFCTVVITTVGYGHSTPATTAGKLFYILFALVGIPMGLVMFQSTGERVNTGVKHCLQATRDYLARRRRLTLREVKSRHLLMVSSSIGSLTILVGTLVFHRNEGWSLFDAFYYCVITLSTIGLGDHVAAQRDRMLDQRPGYVLFTLFFILFGLAIFSACINLLILEFMATNADIVTAKGRIRRLLSMRRTVSFKKARPRPASPPRPIRAEAAGRGSADYVRALYSYYRTKPVKYSVRRPPLYYIDHLVHSHGHHTKT